MKIIKTILPMINRPAAIMLFIALMAGYSRVYAQAPALPPTNLGLANIYDGVAGKPGFVFQGYVQLYQTRGIYDADGNNSGSSLKINSLLAMNQFIYLSPVKIWGGNLGFTVLLPVVKITATNLSGPAPSVNPGAFGDLVQGTAIQWNDKKLFGKSFWHRIEFDFTLPTGSYNSTYAINASSHLWTFGFYHAFTMFLNKDFTISSRNQLNYNTNIIGRPDRPGAYYNGNYSIDYSLLKNFKVMAAAYYLYQLNEDSYNGDHNYYQNTYGLATTKERAFGIGPGIAYFVPGGALLEAKVFMETSAKNTTKGTRPTIRIAVPF